MSFSFFLFAPRSLVHNSYACDQLLAPALNWLLKCFWGLYVSCWTTSLCLSTEALDVSFFRTTFFSPNTFLSLFQFVCNSKVYVIYCISFFLNLLTMECPDWVHMLLEETPRMECDWRWASSRSLRTRTLHLSETSWHMQLWIHRTTFFSPNALRQWHMHDEFTILCWGSGCDDNPATLLKCF